VSIRYRLTLLNLAVLCGALALFSTIIYALLAWNLDREITESLQQQYTQIDASTNRFLIVPGPAGQQLLVPNQRPDTFSSEELDVFVQIAQLDGVIPEGGRSSNLRDLQLPLDEATLRVVRDGETILAREVVVGGRRMRLYSGPMYAPIDRRRVVVGVIQVARSLERTEATLNLVRLLLGVAGLGSLLVAGVAGWVASGRALAPLKRLTRAVREIGTTRDLSQRVPSNGRADEVGHLALTFNEMLAELQAAQNGLATSLETQKRFLADASHELRTPLTTIRGNVEMLRRFAAVTDGDREAALADIDSEAERMSRLVNQMLSLARADTTQPAAKEPLDLAPIVEESARQLALLARAQGLTTVAAPIESVRVLASPDAVRQLLLILIDNAIKYTPAPGEIRLSLTRTETQAIVEVGDTGIGIETDKLPHIFERFYRADPARAGEGGGLGLAIARGLVGALNGQIEVASTPGQGSTFRIALPRLSGE
jgi:two-component system, OmpR family, sensor kinase